MTAATGATGATGATVATGPAPRRPRHVHSPRVRRAAGRHGVDLSGVAGTGRGGRVTVDDVLRLGTTATDRGMAPVPGSAFGIAVAEVDVTRVPADLLVPAAVRAVADAAGDLASSWVADGVLVVRGGRATPLPDAADLTVAGVGRRLAADGALGGSARSARPRLAVVGPAAPGVLLAAAPPPEGVRVALAVGSPAERPTVVRDGDGLPSIAVRTLVHLTVTHDSATAPEAAGRLLAQVAERLRELVAAQRVAAASGT
jgi:hypothetical protein